MSSKGRPASTARRAPAPRMWPLYGAGFVTAFGAHSIAANLGAYIRGDYGGLLTLGILLALYDGAEVLLKPVFGSLADRVGLRRVLLGGLIAFAACSAAFAAVGSDPALLGLARFGQGAAAAAFSPAASALLARLAPNTTRGRAFGGYGAAKSLGYTLGPVLGGMLIAFGGFGVLFAALTLLAAGVAVWIAFAVPPASVLPRRRQSLLDLARGLARREFLMPVIALAGATAALSAGVGFLPVRGLDAGLSPLATGAVVSLLALTATVTQPWAGRARDRESITDRLGLAVGLGACAAGFVMLGALAGLAGLLPAAVLIGAGTGLITPLGFAAIADTAIPERLGQTMGSAEIGRELGDAGGPLLVGSVAAATILSGGLFSLAAVLAAAAVAHSVIHRGPSSAAEDARSREPD